MSTGKPRKRRAPAPPTTAARMREVLAPRLAGSAGAALVRPGAAFSVEQDRLFACGWPHVGIADPAEPRDATPRQAVAEELTRPAPFAAGWRWPGRAAPLLARARFAADYVWREVDGRRLRAPIEVDALCDQTSDAPMSATEAMELARRMVAESPRGWPHGRVSLFLLEAIAGAEPVARAVTDALEATSDAGLTALDKIGSLVIWELGFVLLRVARAEAARLRDRLEAVFERARANHPWEFDRYDSAGGAARRLDVVLHGRRGAARSGHRLGGADGPLDGSALVHVVDQPDWVADQLARIEVGRHTPLWGRAVFLGGDRAIAAEAARWPRYTGAGEHRAIVEQLAELAHPAITVMLEEMAVRSRARALARDRLAARTRSGA